MRVLALLFLLTACGKPPAPAPPPEPGTPAALLHEFCTAMLRGDGEAALACVVDSKDGACAKVLPVAAELTRLAADGDHAVHPIGDPSYYRNIRAMGLDDAREGDELALPPGADKPCTLVRKDAAWRFDMSSVFEDPAALVAELRAQSGNIRSRAARSSR